MNEDIEFQMLVVKDWGGRMLTFWGNEIVFEKVDLPIKVKIFLKKIGLPILGFQFAIEFIPISLLSWTNVNGQNYCVLGDFSTTSPGISFMGLVEGSEAVYHISRKIQGGWEETNYLNSSLDKFVVFLHMYCSFMKKYKEIGDALIDGEEMLKEYNEMKLRLTNLDPIAMQDDNYWDNMVASIQGVYGDFLL